MQPRLTVMTDTEQVASAASSQDPAVGLKGVRSLRTLVERLEDLQVRNARVQGWTWEQIAQLLGVTRQAVHKKYASGRGPLRRKD
jgi:DNA-directed RNA polymerase specialized sigma24 family protein